VRKARAGSDAHAAPAAAAVRPPIETILKWIGAAAAVLSLIAGSFQVTRLVSDVRERKRFIAETLDVAQRQQTGGDYAAAWNTLESGVKSADEGGQFAKVFGQLSDERQRLRTAQEDLAMAWLRNLHVSGGKRFSDFVDHLLPVLDRGAATTSGTARADRIAHIGWGYYLKLRDGPGTLDPPGQYRLALQTDAANAYAHAYLGHWMVWQRESLGNAMAHFDEAAKNAATRTYVRSIELAALRGRTDPATSAQLLRVVDEMRRNGEPLRPANINDAYDVYNSMVLDGGWTAIRSWSSHPPATSR
jgi:hypothetical protein